MNRALIGLVLFTGMLLLCVFTTGECAYEHPLLKEADTLRDEKSYHAAAELYGKILGEAGLPEETVREISFKFADCSWRTKEESRYAGAEKTLRELVESREHDRWWAEANESLAEFRIERRSHNDEVKQYLENARDFWAGSTDINLARKRFIRVSFTFGDFTIQHWGGWGYTGLHSLYEDILKVADTVEDKSKAHYSLGMCYYQRYRDGKEKSLAEKHFKEVIEKYTSTEWLDDAYYQLGQYYERENDFVKAVNIYRELLSHFEKGDSKFVDDTKRRIEDITSPQLRVSVGYSFLTNSEIRFNLNWRNVNEAEITFYKMDLTEELRLNPKKSETEYERGVDNYTKLLKDVVESNRYTSMPVTLSWKRKLKDEGKHLWYNEDKGLAEWQMADEKDSPDSKKGILPPGAYLLLVTSGKVKTYDLVMVTDMALVAKTAGHSALFFTCDAATGKPRENVQVKFHYSYYDDNRRWLWEEGNGKTDSSGLLKVTLKTSDKRNYNNQHTLFTCASDGTMQAFSQGNYHSYSDSSKTWWLYAFADRPAYRPNEEISFKGILRQYDSSVFTTQAGMKIKARILDPRGNKVKEETWTLNDYGSFNDSLKLDDKALLGEYRIELWTDDWRSLANATLFRLEEYKLPEFLVNIKPKPRKDEEKTASYRLGDIVSVEVDAQYYFGGPVADAEVEYIIYQNEHYHLYYPPRQYGWYYEDMYQRNYYRGNGQLIKQTRIKTDTEGKAIFTFETPEKSPNDLRYHIEVRVVDQSRREIRAAGDIKVTRTSYFAFLTPKHNLYRPGDKAEIEIKTLNAMDEPVVADGKIIVTRNWWKEPVIEGDKITRPAGYDTNELFTRFVKTNVRGEAVFEFQPERDGYYVIDFTGFDSGGIEVKAQTNVFVCEKQSKEIGYRYGGLQIIADKDTYSVGEIASVMLVSDRPGTWVLFTTEAEEIYTYEIVHLEGSVKLLQVPVIDSFEPNVFFTASSADNYQLRTYKLQTIVPPDEKFLNVKVTSDKEEYNPQEEGKFDILVTDKDGKPVSAELALGIVDSSVHYIQSEYAPDIRKYFYGDKRNHAVTTQTSFYQKRYLKFVRDENNVLMTEDELKRKVSGTGVVIDGQRTGGGLRNVRVSGDISVSGEYREERLDRSSMNEIASLIPASKEMAKQEAPSTIVEAEGELVTPEVRTDFRSTVLWQPSIITDENGKANINVKFPDSLTTWRATARAITKGTVVGNVTHETRTSKDIIVRLQAPRFFTERDEVTISANVHNFTDKEEKIKVTLEAKGLEISGNNSTWVTIQSKGEKRVDWRCKSKKAGIAELTVLAQTKKESDAMKKSYPIIPHGIEKFIARAVVLKGDENKIQETEFLMEIPKERILESTSLQLTISPSMAAAMLDALPYLADYPYGCVEQTMSRFLPAVIVAKTLRDLGFSEKDVTDYINNVLNPRKDPGGHAQRKTEPSLSELQKMTEDGLNRLYDFQHSDGGWGWWKDDPSDRFMSGYVLWGLALAEKAGIRVKSGVISNGISYLQKELVEEENNPDMLTWMLHALGEAKSRSKYEDKQIDRLWEMRDKLNPYTRALFALSEYYRGNSERAEILARNIVNGIQEDKENGTVHWGESGVHYRWSEGGVEATAFCIKALSNILPQSSYLEPSVKWLALNRRGARWKNTRDTAIAILGLADYLKTTNELVPDYDYEVFVNGKSVSKGHVGTTNMFTFNRYIELPNEALKDGRNTVKVTLKGKGALYLSGYLRYFTLEEGITPAGNEVFVERKYFREDMKETLLKGYVPEWKVLSDGDKIKSGDRVRVEITINAKNHYEYMVVEDYKPAGCEAVELKSGSGEADALDHEGYESGKTWLYREFRDQKAVFFITKLPQGRHRIRYELRAEVPGEFHGMPNQVHAMYVPEIRANSTEIRLEITD